MNNECRVENNPIIIRVCSSARTLRREQKMLKKEQKIDVEETIPTHLKARRSSRMSFIVVDDNRK
jgi:hypothetical protein